MSENDEKIEYNIESYNSQNVLYTRESDDENYARVDTKIVGETATSRYQRAELTKSTRPGTDLKVIPHDSEVHVEEPIKNNSRDADVFNLRVGGGNARKPAAHEIKKLSRGLYTPYPATIRKVYEKSTSTPQFP